MTRFPLTHAVGVTAEEVARLGNTYSAKDLRGIQRKLTATAGELRTLANSRHRGGGLIANLGALLTPEQCQLLLDTAQLVESVGNSVTHAKEKRVRHEKDTKKRQDARDAHAKQLVAQTYPLPADTSEQQLDVIKAALILNRAQQHCSYYSAADYNLFIRNELKPPVRTYGRTIEQIRAGNLAALRFELIRGLQEHLAYDDGSSVEDRLRLLQEKVAEAVGQAVLTPDERETLRLWKEALAPAAEQQERKP